MMDSTNRPEKEIQRNKRGWHNRWSKANIEAKDTYMGGERCP